MLDGRLKEVEIKLIEEKGKLTEKEIELNNAKDLLRNNPRDIYLFIIFIRKQVHNEYNGYIYIYTKYK